MTWSHSERYWKTRSDAHPGGMQVANISADTSRTPRVITDASPKWRESYIEGAVWIGTAIMHRWVSGSNTSRDQARYAGVFRCTRR
jgi:hypothetical protein